MIAIYFYELSTGLLRPGFLRASNLTDDFIEANTPAGFKAITGVTDPRCQRVDIETGKIVPYRPPAPDQNHNWNGKRWVKHKEIAAKDREIRVATLRIKALEAKQPRAVREALLDRKEGKSRLAAIDAEIAELRRIIT